MQRTMLIMPIVLLVMGVLPTAKAEPTPEPTAEPACPAGTYQFSGYPGDCALICYDGSPDPSCVIAVPPITPNAEPVLPSALPNTGGAGLSIQLSGRVSR